MKMDATTQQQRHNNSKKKDDKNNDMNNDIMIIIIPTISYFIPRWQEKPWTACSRQRSLNLGLQSTEQANQQSIGLRENLQESLRFSGKICGFLWFPVDFPLNQSIEIVHWQPLKPALTMAGLQDDSQGWGPRDNFDAWHLLKSTLPCSGIWLIHLYIYVHIYICNMYILIYIYIL
jgi:hypothetical protein